MTETDPPPASQPAQPPLSEPVKSWRQLQDFAPLLLGEVKLLKAAQAGKECDLHQPLAHEEQAVIWKAYVRNKHLASQMLTEEQKQALRDDPELPANDDLPKMPTGDHHFLVRLKDKTADNEIRATFFALSSSGW